MKSLVFTTFILSIALLSAFEPIQLSISQVQGDSSRSFYADQLVTVQGTVTYSRSTSQYREIYLQSLGQAEGASSAIMVFTRGKNLENIEPGTVLLVAGRVMEFSSGDNNPITQIIAAPERIKTVGKSEVAVSSVVIENVPQDINEAIRYYESLEFMKVEIPNARVVGQKDNYIYIIPEAHAHAHLNAVGGITVTAEDTANPGKKLFGTSWMNRYRFQVRPERIAVRLSREQIANSSIGDRIENLSGFLNLKYGTPILEGVETIKVVEIGPDPETITHLEPEKERLLIGAYNIENFSLLARDSDQKIEALARQIVEGMKSPDVLTLTEVGDDDDTLNSVGSPLAGSEKSLKALVEAIAKLNGPGYRVVEKLPLAHAEGGRPGLNIRVVFLYNPERVVPAKSDSEPLVYRIPRPERPFAEQYAFLNTRRCLAAKFTFLETNRDFYLIGCHLKSKRGDLPTLSLNRNHDELYNSSIVRRKQTRAILNEVNAIRSREPDIPILVAGDFNDHHLSVPMRVLVEPGPLVNLTVQELDPEDRFTYCYEGASQALDHILVTSESARGAEYDIIHINSGRNDDDEGRFSDHDPVLASLLLSGPHDSFEAALWMHQAEYHVLAKSIFDLARSRLDELIENSADFEHGKPLAVVLDVDETVLDNSPFQARIINRRQKPTAEAFNEWIFKEAAPALPGAKKYIERAEQLGIKPIFITNRVFAPHATEDTNTKLATLRNLRSRLSPNIESGDLLLKGEEEHEVFPVAGKWTSEKESRREAVREKYQVIQWIGDDLGDFLPDLKKYAEITPEQRTDVAMAVSGKWLSEFFLIPNPTYGSWKQTVLANDRAFLRGF